MLCGERSVFNEGKETKLHKNSPTHFQKPLFYTKYFPLSVESPDTVRPLTYKYISDRYCCHTKCVKKAASLTKKSKTDLAKVKKVYRYVVKNFKYDK